ncbi:MAG: GNAT family N-acetyltransferase [Ruminococcaceae bacterium]|nr:GNAT family N-acetyltransferase [Oscillospiraceae bacterium]
MKLYTERCIIRNFRTEDAEDLYKVLSDEEVMKYIEPVFDFEKTENFIKNCGLCEPPLVYAVVRKETEKVIGHLIFHSFDESAHEIGWVINRNFWGIGIANELTKAITDYSKSKKIKSLVMEFDEKQSASRHIALKNGFVYEGKTDNLELYRLVL